MEGNHVEENDRERARLKALVERLTDEDLARPVTGQWSIADMLGHMAFWDARASALAEKIERGIPFTESDFEPEDVDVLNAAAARLIQEIPPRRAAQLALETAEDADRRVAGLPPEKMWPRDEHNPLNCFRSSHRGEHLDLIEAARR